MRQMMLPHLERLLKYSDKKQAREVRTAALKACRCLIESAPCDGSMEVVGSLESLLCDSNQDVRRLACEIVEIWINKEKDEDMRQRIRAVCAQQAVLEDHESLGTQFAMLAKI